jgi:Zn finger protein HypA/HybF involved in hydrogenase expression
VTNTDDILLAMQEAVRKSLAEAANAEIEKQKHRFECEMGEVKSELIGKLVNNIQIKARQALPGGDYTIQIVLRGDGK